MSITLTCTCGQRIGVPENHAGKQTTCPRCGREVHVPAMGRPAGSPAQQPTPTAENGPSRTGRVCALLAAAIGLVLIVAGIVVIANNLSAPSENERQALGVEIKQREESREERKPKGIVEVSVPEHPEPKPPKEEKKLPPAPPPPIPEIVRVEPAKPSQGGNLILELKTGDNGVSLQYRTGPKEEWLPVRDKRIVFSKLSGPKLIVEFRALDDQGRVSEILSRTWDLLPPPVIAGGPLILEWKLKQGDVIFQELKVIQKPTYSILGVFFNTSLQYTVLSSFRVEKAGPEGLEIKQKVEAAQLLQADALTQGILAPAVLKLPGTTFTINLNPRMEVTKFTAGAKPFQMANLLGGHGLQLASLLDHDGWKEMAELTFFQPNRPLEKNAKWSRKMTHNWGSLGSWAGKIHYTYAGKERGLKIEDKGLKIEKAWVHKIAYGLDMTYNAPKAKGMLPIKDAAFKPQIAGGVIHFDAERGKVIEAQERFHVRGRLTMTLLGQNSPVEIDEDQLFYIRIWERDPRGK